MSFVSTAVQRVLEDGQFCAVAAPTPNGPHCTPLVFAYSGARLWLTTSRRSVKARSWRVDPSTAGLIRDGDLSVAFTGSVKTYDALDKRTWGAAVAGATSIARATAGFSRKNARFFAGYAFDARQVPFAWTPPGRVFVGVDLERTALLEGTRSLLEHQVEEVVMESTAQYWKPVWAALERHWKPSCAKREGGGPISGTLHLAQAQSNRGRRGRKRDFPDAERLVKRLVAQELTLSFVPDAEQRLWRTLTRRKYQLTCDKVRLQNQLEALLEEAHIKLSSLVSDLLGASARRM